MGVTDDRESHLPLTADRYQLTDRCHNPHDWLGWTNGGQAGGVLTTAWRVGKRLWPTVAMLGGPSALSWGVRGRMPSG